MRELLFIRSFQRENRKNGGGEIIKDRIKEFFFLIEGNELLDLRVNYVFSIMIVRYMVRYIVMKFKYIRDRVLKNLFFINFFLGSYWDMCFIKIREQLGEDRGFKKQRFIQEIDEENFQDKGERKVQEDNCVVGQRQVDGGFWKDTFRKKMELLDYLMC